MDVSLIHPLSGWYPLCAFYTVLIVDECVCVIVGKFVNRIVCQSNCPELLSLKKVMSQRLMSLVQQSVVDKICVDIEFVTDNKKFEAALEDNFGHFKLKDDSNMKKQQQQHGYQALKHLPNSHHQQQQPYYPTSTGLVRQPSSAISEVKISVYSTYVNVVAFHKIPHN